MKTGYTGYTVQRNTGSKGRCFGEGNRGVRVGGLRGWDRMRRGLTVYCEMREELVGNIEDDEKRAKQSIPCAVVHSRLILRPWRIKRHGILLRFSFWPFPLLSFFYYTLCFTIPVVP